ncbi:DUF6471 domain-containing protein [Paraburkholderia phytofirmans]|uniref:DUF6471 domain-containing protein n=1 Tax=Paraburkholderia phytofirmans TaxID=261302 RepID=UPI0007B60A11|nr:DUF6471 domain-containing protein [Paraburkholderia phytofirmans]
MTQMPNLLEIDWEYESKELLKRELRKQGVTYRRLAELLREGGLDETERSVTNKITRGSYRMAFFLQVLKTIGSDKAVLFAPLTPDQEARIKRVEIA